MAKQEVYELSKGATLIYQKQSIFNGSNVIIGFLSGSRLDGKYKGLSHFLEHMLFQHEDEKSKTKIKDKILRYTIDQNAFTTNDSICLSFSATNDNLSGAIDNAMSLITRRDFTDRAINQEREVVKQEINLQKDECYDVNAFDFLMNTLSEDKCEVDHDTILGSARTLNLITPELLKEYQRRYFNSQNMIISITSNLPAKKIIELCENEIISKIPLAKSDKYILDFPPRPTFIQKNALCVIPNLDTQNVNINIVLRSAFEEGQDVDKEFAYNVVEEYIMNSLKGPLYEQLRDKEGLVYSYALSNLNVADDKFKIFSATTNATKMRKSIQKICELVREIGSKGFSEKDFNNVKAALTDIQNARKQKFKSSSARDNYFNFIHGEPFIDYKRVMQFIKDMDFEDFNKHIASVYKAANVSVAVDGCFDKRKMFRLIEIEQMLGNYSHSHQFGEFNTPIVELTDMPDKTQEKYEKLMHEEYAKQFNDTIMDMIQDELSKYPTIKMDEEIEKKPAKNSKKEDHAEMTK